MLLLLKAQFFNSSLLRKEPPLGDLFQYYLHLLSYESGLRGPKKKALRVKRRR